MFKPGLRPGVKLSAGYANSRDHYKVVEPDNVLAYIVSGGGRQSAARIYPIYRADIFYATMRKHKGKLVKVQGVSSSYEQGAALNGFTFFDDYEGCTFATIAFQAINALEERARLLKAQKPTKTKTEVKKKPKVKAKTKAKKAPERMRQDNASGPGN